MLERIIGVLKLDVNTYEEIEADQTATTQAAIVVVAVAILSGIGNGFAGNSFIGGFISTAVWALIGWVIWSAVTYFVGTSFFGGKADLGQMLRVIGYAQAPQALNFLGFIPVLGGIISFVAAIWSLVTAFIAVRQGLDLDNTKAAITVVIGWIIVFVGGLIIGSLFAGAAIMGGAIAS